MHITKGATCNFQHSGDFEGDVHILDRINGNKVTVPFTDLKLLVAAYVRSRKIAKLEAATSDGVLSCSAYVGPTRPTWEDNQR